MYTLEHTDSVVSEPTLSHYWLLREEADVFSKEELEEHFSNIHKLLTSRIAELTEEDHLLTQTDEKELQFMLQALIQAKLLLQNI